MKMMKNKSSVIVLVVVAAVVWGTILYRVIVYTGGERVITAKGKKKELAIVKQDSLLLDYRDPFLGTVPGAVSASVPIRQEAVVPEVPDEPPAFRFAGKIRKGKSDFLLIEAGMETRLVPVKEKEIDGYTVEQVYCDSIRVRKGKKRYTISIE